MYLVETHDPQLFKIFAPKPVLQKNRLEDRVRSKKLRSEAGRSNLPAISDDFPPPHSKDLPLAERSEEILLTYLIKLSTLGKPIFDFDELDGLIIHKSRHSFL